MLEELYLTAILFRCAYGGLKCDPPMISKCVDWYLQNEKDLIEFDVERWSEPLPKFLFNPACVDFHIWSNLTLQLSDIHSEYSSDYIKQVIWLCSSSINKRMPDHEFPVMLNSHCMHNITW